MSSGSSVRITARQSALKFVLAITRRSSIETLAPRPRPPAMAPSPGAAPSSSAIPSSIALVPSPSASPPRLNSASCPGSPSAPPPRPDLRPLTADQAKVARRAWERVMYQWMTQHGAPASDTCGPCDRTGSACIRHSVVKKCALCFRGHDVCEMWDESVVNIGRRRASMQNHMPNKVCPDLGAWSVVVVREMLIVGCFGWEE